MLLWLVFNYILPRSYLSPHPSRLLLIPVLFLWELQASGLSPMAAPSDLSLDMGLSLSLSKRIILLIQIILAPKYSLEIQEYYLKKKQNGTWAHGLGLAVLDYGWVNYLWVFSNLNHSMIPVLLVVNVQQLKNEVSPGKFVLALHFLCLPRVKLWLRTEDTGENKIKWE